MKLIFFLIPLYSLGEVQIHDYVTPLIQEYRVLKKPSMVQRENLILRNEFILGDRLNEVYYERLKESEKRKLLENVEPIAKALPTLIPIYEKKMIELKKIISNVEEKYKKDLGIELKLPVYVWVALANTDGKATDINDQSGFSLNFRLLGESPIKDLEIVVAHEFFHVAQDSLMGPGNNGSVARQLMSEGWATYVSSVIVPGSKDFKYVSYWMDDDRRYKEYKKHEKQAIASILTNYEKSGWEVTRRYFSGDPKDSKPFPPRIGYYLGYKLAQRMAETSSSAEVATMKFSEFKVRAKKLLKEMHEELK